MKGLRSKSPLRLAVEGVLIGTFMTVVVTQGDFSAAWQVGIGLGIVCGLIGLAYRGAQSARGITPSGERQTTKLFGLWTISRGSDTD